MLRGLFNEPKRIDSGLLLEAGNAVRTYMKNVESERIHLASSDYTKFHRQAIWSKGFIDALDELEQSKFCCERYGERIRKAYLEEMNPEETEVYQGFVYFYKNAFIRLFSILDKLGTFMNDLFGLKTETVKSRFSYFTVLRHMHEHHIHGPLELQLYTLKMDYKEPLERLRNLRNVEIHYINAEMLDDLMHKDPMLGERIHIENVQSNLSDLQQGFDMVCRTLTIAFTYITAYVTKG
ncbi:Cthe_2314 family HEPN domain-containing protein [Paenibacillus roseipurpureus]|uniref:Cthe_2314 family HEPN domain-containing protein n=1 Tax=Paenibacillus roseopurpureus TaxID=2918901 RepID=A0AA96RLG5_9BACL|nr:Cthe_2314 family HEPN domain-containing protein [Paenibacillus sp. MBLB1832]WNR45635.1 Cthe_2314 family HEPN domain-containing protein [Paenibacillus sp. MBLB1832]